MSAAEIAFQIVYNALYILLYIVLLGLLIVTPADLIHQSLSFRQDYDILIIALIYLVTIIIVAFIYAARLYISRSVIASIPKQWVPVEKGDMPRDVRQMVLEGLSRSAVITYESRPRVPPVALPREPEPTEDKDHIRSSHPRRLQLHDLRKRGSEEGTITISIPPHKPPWGDIEHPGWGSPLSPDLPDLQYTSVISELPNLIEAKAMTLAPEDSGSPGGHPMLDPEALSLLQRDGNMGLRDYLSHLTELGVLAASPTTYDFIAKFEFARYSNRPLSNERFRELMHLFAEVLRNLSPLDPDALDLGFHDNASSSHMSYDTDIDNDAPMETNPATPVSGRSLRSQRSHDSGNLHPVSASTASSRPRRAHGAVGRASSANTWQYRTAPTTPKSRQTGMSRSSSANTFAQTRHPYVASQASSSSLRSASAASVIRLAEASDQTDLPYVLTHARTQ